VTVNNKEENSFEDFCLNFVQEFGLWTVDSILAVDNHNSCQHKRGSMPTYFKALNGFLLGYDLYGSALADILTEPSLSMPITVGLYAKWGSGKSFLLKKLRQFFCFLSLGLDR
jgi:hypothetical protein